MEPASEVKVGQIYADNDPRMEGRTFKVLSLPETPGERYAFCEVLTNANDIQALLDDSTPGTRSYQPKDRRGRTMSIRVSRLIRGGNRGYRLVEDA